MTNDAIRGCGLVLISPLCRRPLCSHVSRRHGKQSREGWMTVKHEAIFSIWYCQPCWQSTNIIVIWYPQACSQSICTGWMLVTKGTKLILIHAWGEEVEWEELGLRQLKLSINVLFSPSIRVSVHSSRYLWVFLSYPVVFYIVYPFVPLSRFNAWRTAIWRQQEITSHPF